MIKNHIINNYYYYYITINSLLRPGVFMGFFWIASPDRAGDAHKSISASYDIQMTLYLSSMCEGYTCSPLVHMIFLSFMVIL